MPIEATLLISVGELSARKNHSAIIRALAQNNDANIHYVIAGTGRLYDDLKGLVKSLNIEKQVHLLGYRSDIPDLYRSADICLFPSLQEGLPVAVMEAMAAGLPIIASCIRGTSDLLQNSENYLVKSNDNVAEFAKAIALMRNNMLLGIRQGIENQEQIEEYDIGIINRLMIQIYVGY